MTPPLLDGIKKFQEYVFEIGLARSVLALPAPRMLSLPSPTSEISEPASVFARLITESEISDVSADLFMSGHYNISVAEAYKAVDKFIAGKVPFLKVSGTALMEQAFNPSGNNLRLSQLSTSSEVDEQKGYHRIFAGAMLGIRNPATHEFNWVEEPETALELIVLAQHLIRKAKSSFLEQDSAC